MKATGLSQEAFDKGLKEDARLFAAVGRSLGDIAVGFIPFIGGGRDLYQAVSGKNIISGARLTRTERMLSAASAMTAGMIIGVKGFRALKALANDANALQAVESEAVALSQTLTKGGLTNEKALDDLAKVVREAGSEPEQQKIIHDLSVNVFEKLEANGIKINISEVKDAGWENAVSLSRGREVAYAENSFVVVGKAVNPIDAVRVYGPTNQVVGPWLTLREFVNGKSAVEIQKDVLNLPQEIDHIVDVRIPSGAKLEVSVAGKNGFGSGNGALQIRLPSETLDKTWFSNPRSLQ
jgi:hypothetical protein